MEQAITFDMSKVSVVMARKGLTKCALANKAGMTPAMITRIFSRGYCRPKTAGRIAEALNIDVTEIMAEE